MRVQRTCTLSSAGIEPVVNSPQPSYASNVLFVSPNALCIRSHRLVRFVVADEQLVHRPVLFLDDSQRYE